jgi:low affinity Fe/Cu permease
MAQPSKLSKAFGAIASRIAHAAGRPIAFILCAAIIILWAVSGPIFGFSDTWQLIINTGTTIVTFLMVFLIQNTQNRDNHALHLKIDELLCALDAADTRLVDLEERSEQELQRLHDHYIAVANGSAGDEQTPNRSEPAARDRTREGNRDRRQPRNQVPRRGVQEPEP